MTRATFVLRGDSILAVRVKGHAGYAESGSDIVCSAISVACHMAALGLTEVMGLSADAQANGADVTISVSERDIGRAQVMLKTLERELIEIRSQYPDHLSIGYQERRETSCSS